MPRKKRTSDDRVVLQNAVKTLAANIRFSSVDDPIKTIAVVSSIPSEGKTTVSANLGAALVGSGTSALIVECDMRRRSMANELQVHGRHGLYSVLSGRHTLEEAVVPTKTKGLYFLDAEPGIPNPADLLQSKRFHELIGQLSRTFGYVLFDTPPISTFIDAAVISSLVDATVLVVRQDYTRREDVVDSLNQLKQAGANVIGTALNFCDAEASSKYYGYYKEKRGSRSTAAGAPNPVSNQQVVEQSTGLKPIPERSSLDAVVPSLDAHAGTSAAEDAARSQQDSIPVSNGNRDSAPRRFVPRNRGGNSSSKNPADETMAFLSQTGYAPRHNSDSDGSQE